MLPLEKDVRVERLGWFIQLRWIAVVGGLALMAVGPFVLPLDIQYARLALCVLVLGGFNAAYYFYWRHLNSAGVTQSLLWEKAKRLLHFQMAADLSLLTLMLFLSGGAENPLIFFYLFHLAISAMIFTVGESLIYAGLALILPWFLFFLEQMTPSHVSLWEGVAGMSQVHERSILWAYSLTVAGLWFFLSRLTHDLRSRESELRDTSEQLLGANEQLKQLDIYKNRFLKQVIFQLKSPAIEMDFDLSSVEKAIPVKNLKATEAVKTAKKRVWILLELIEDLVWLSRVEVQDVPFKKDWIDVYEVLLKRVQMVEQQAKQKGIDLQLHGDSQIRLRADREAFERAADNLLSNAVKYTPAGPHTILVDFKLLGDWLVFSVQDQGIGIPPKQREKIFEEFYRASNAKALEKFGTGLGLTIVKRILDLHGGKIEISTEPKEGTRVETWWPMEMVSRTHPPRMN